MALDITAVLNSTYQEDIMTSDYVFSNLLSSENTNNTLTNDSWLLNVSSNDKAQQPDKSLVEFQEQSRFWIQRILVPIIMIIGVIGNTMTIFIMTQRRMRSSTNWYLAALAIFDMSYLVFSFILSLQHYPNIHDLNYYAYWKMWPYLLTITDSSSNSSVWITVTFTIERYIAVCHPMKGKVICTESRAKKMIIIVFLTSFIITLPTAFEWNIIEVVNAQNITEVRADISDLGLNPYYVSIYYWIVSILFVIIPIILLAVFNAFLIKSVHSSKSQRKTMTRRRETGDQARQESKITIMLIAVVILFLMCQLPTAVILLYKSFHHVEPFSNEDYLLRGLGNIFNFLVAVNAAGNFVLYCLLSQKYRRTLLMIFCPCLKGKITRIHSAYQNTVYTTMENESPHASRKHSIRPPPDALKPLNSCRQQPQKSVPTRSQQLSFSKKVVVFPDENNSYSPTNDTHNRRLLRGFRCPWKRQKIATRSNDDDRTGQFIPLKSPTKTAFESNSLSVENTG